jgi:GntR family transcriptional regulator, transcriptional repressor for pyruvate dehydrogenase complex
MTRRGQRAAVALERLDVPGVKERVAGRLRDLIETGSLAAGEQLPSERELAEQFGVSRSTVREAVQFLGALGLVEIRHGSGTFVRADRDRASLPSEWVQWTQLHKVEVHELLEVRRGLETLAAELAAEAGRPESLRGLEEALMAMEAALEEPDVPALVEADLAFHDALAAASGNTALRHLIDSLGRELLRERGATWNSPGRPERSLREHRRIYEAVLAGDPAAARAAIVEHLQSIQHDVDALVGEPSTVPNRDTKAR